MEADLRHSIQAADHTGSRSTPFDTHFPCQRTTRRIYHVTYQLRACDSPPPKRRPRATCAPRKTQHAKRRRAPPFRGTNEASRCPPHLPAATLPGVLLHRAASSQTGTTATRLKQRRHGRPSLSTELGAEGHEGGEAGGAVVHVLGLLRTGPSRSFSNPACALASAHHVRRPRVLGFSAHLARRTSIRAETPNPEDLFLPSCATPACPTPPWRAAWSHARSALRRGCRPCRRVHRQTTYQQDDRCTAH